MLNGLDLFSGIGGIALALRPWVRTVCYVESEPYCQAVLCARMAERRLDGAPLWDDVTTFAAEPWAGAVDVVTAGFPCQDVSVAGRGAGLAGERTGLWREIIRIAGVVGPRFIFLENVPGLLTTNGGRDGWTVASDLAALGYDARWGVLSAHDVGAPHFRERWWCLAHAQREPVAISDGRRQQECPEQHSEAPQGAADRSSRRQHADGCGNPLAQPGGPGLAERAGAPAERAHAAVSGDGGWPAEPDVGRVADGVPHRVDRLRGLGNAVVPQAAAEAWCRLMGLNDPWKDAA